MAVYQRDYFQCCYPHCHIIGAKNLQMAHGIAQTQANIDMIRNEWYRMFNEPLGKKFIEDNMIHSADNLYTSCIAHNDYFNYGNNPQLVRGYLLIKWLEFNDFEGDKLLLLKDQFNEKRMRYLLKGEE